jgi:Right handed beta helix region
MPTGLLPRLASAAAAALGAISWVVDATAGTAIDSCGTLSALGATYVLTRDLESCGTCLVVANDRITIDLGGHAIGGFCGGEGVSDGGQPRHRTTVKNGAITGFDVGINLVFSTHNVLRDVESSENSGIGIIAGPRSLIKDCVIKDNGSTGILILEYGQVQNCFVTGHLAATASGISAGNHQLIRDNWVENNAVGILAGDFSTVSFNTLSHNMFSGLSVGNHSLGTGNVTNRNGLTGIATGALSTVSHNISNRNSGSGIDVGTGGLLDGRRSLITGNTTNDNGGVGIEARCPSTVTNNNSSGNGSNYTFNGPGCHTRNNKQ